MKKYARLRPPAVDKFEERSNVLYNSRPEISLEEDPHQARPPPSDGSASPQRNSLRDFQIPRATQREDRPSSSGPSHTDLTEALKKLSSFREGGSRGNSGRWQGGGGGGANGEHRSRHGSGTWGVTGGQEGGTSSGRWGPHDGSSGNGRWGAADPGSLSGHWGSIGSAVDHWDEPQGVAGNIYRDNLALSRAGRLMQEGEAWSATNTSSANAQFIRSSSLRDGPTRLSAVAEVQRSRQSSHFYNGGEGGHHHLGAAVQRNISMRDTQGWLASIQRPQTLQNPQQCLPPANFPSTSESSLWEDPNEFSWTSAASSSTQPPSKKATATQSMRYDRLNSNFGTSPVTNFDDERSSRDRNYYIGGPSVMQKAASMREGGAHSDAIMAMAKAYSEKHGVPQAILECVSCGRGLGVVVQGNPGIDTSFCQSCRPPALSWNYPTSKLSETKSKKKGMMHYCKKILRLGRKPSKLKL